MLIIRITIIELSINRITATKECGLAESSRVVVVPVHSFENVNFHLFIFHVSPVLKIFLFLLLIVQ
jgi:hypothetical protein